LPDPPSNQTGRAVSPLLAAKTAPETLKGVFGELQGGETDDDVPKQIRGVTEKINLDIFPLCEVLGFVIKDLRNVRSH
jgi:hypothetical protein